MAPVIAWGVGWAAGLVAVGAAVFAAQWRVPWVLCSLMLVVGALSFGLPARLNAKRRGSKRANAEAAVWVIGFWLAGCALLYSFGPPGQLASETDVNLVTTEEIRRRNQRSEEPRFSPDTVAAFFVVAGFGFAGGFLSSLAGSASSRQGRWTAAFKRGIRATVAVPVGVVVGVIAIPILGHVVSGPGGPGPELLGLLVGLLAGGFAGGAAMGAILEYGDPGNREGAP